MSNHILNTNVSSTFWGPPATTMVPTKTIHHGQSPEFKFRFVFFPLQMLRFSALCGPNEQNFGKLLT